MPGLSSWKTPGALPEREELEGLVVRSGIVRMSMSTPFRRSMFHGVVDDGEGLQAEEVHLQEAALLDGVHRVLRGDGAVFGSR